MSAPRREEGPRGCKPPAAGFKVLAVLGGGMSVAGLCELCETRPIEDGCERCGRLVCQRHFDAETDLCTSCLAVVRPGRGGEPRPDRPSDRPDGVDIYRF